MGTSSCSASRKASPRSSSRAEPAGFQGRQPRRHHRAVLHADVVVVGGGPAGAAAAITLARAGRDVVVVDKATFPRDKCCGDGLTTGALRELEGLGFDPTSVASWQQVDDVVVRSPSGHEVTFLLPRGRG